ncbi:MAG TPA: c-type cytochrome [Candidatus Xenobia bacterium]|jgi:mono/diheme cytochrome c family protein
MLLAGCGGSGSNPDVSGGAFPDFASDTQPTVPANGYPNSPPTLGQLLRGRYLVNAAGFCNQCHTPENGGGGSDPTNPSFLSGFTADPTLNPFLTGSFEEGPIQSFASNVTPDNTGVANHSPLELFIGLRNGQHHHNFGLMCPPMPWEIYRNMTDDDLWTVVAYLKSIRPVNNLVSFGQTGNGTFDNLTAANSQGVIVPGVALGPADCNGFEPYLTGAISPLPPYPAAQENPVTNTAGTGLPNGPATLSQVLNGRYLVTTVSACAACHGNAINNPNDPHWLGGYIDSPTLNPTNVGYTEISATGGGVTFAPNLTPDPTGLGGNPANPGDGPGGVWTAQDIFNVLKTGLLPDIQQPPPGPCVLPNFVGLPMPWVDFRNMTDDDLWSIVAYIQNLKPVSNVVPESTGIIPTALLYSGLAPLLPPYPAIQEINPNDPASDQ